MFSVSADRVTQRRRAPHTGLHIEAINSLMTGARIVHHMQF